jgi:vancomycin aglycone glucosyltransferase
MRALLVAVGTRGDVQPALALGLELRRRGHDVRVCTSPNFVEWARRLGLDAVPMGVEMRAPARRTGTPASLTPEELRRLSESLPDLVTDQFDTVRAAATECDVIVGANAHQYAAPSIAERVGVGCVTAVYAPVTVPSLDLAPPPPPGQTPGDTTSASIEEQWRAVAALWNKRALERINHNRRTLGLVPIDDVLDYVLTKDAWLAADAALAPLPATPGRHIFQTGAWVLADHTPLPPDLERFLENGEPPLFFGFGSMPAAADTSRRLIGAARAVGRREIVSRGWAGLDEIDDAPDCFMVGDVNHDALFPRVATVVHHGGAGTTAAAARAGAPQVITPMFSDQFYWASRVVALGLGATTPHASMTEASLQSGLLAAGEPVVTERARALARQISADGAAVAAQRLERQYGPA